MLRMKNLTEHNYEEIINGKYSVGNILRSPTGKLWLITRRLSVERIRIKHCCSDPKCKTSQNRYISSLLEWELHKRNISY